MGIWGIAVGVENAVVDFRKLFETHFTSTSLLSLKSTNLIALSNDLYKTTK